MATAGQETNLPRTRRTEAPCRAKRLPVVWVWPRGLYLRVWPRLAQRRPIGLFRLTARPGNQLLDAVLGHPERGGDALHRQGTIGSLRRSCSPRARIVFQPLSASAYLMILSTSRTEARRLPALAVNSRCWAILIQLSTVWRLCCGSTLRRQDIQSSATSSDRAPYMAQTDPGRAGGPHTGQPPKLVCGRLWPSQALEPYSGSTCPGVSRRRAAIPRTPGRPMDTGLAPPWIAALKPGKLAGWRAFETLASLAPQGLPRT
jgi:hypothetical protein